ncbi:MAG: hypothetical protein ACP5EQ_01610 [Candidatus Cloacimonadia bacterium]
MKCPICKKEFTKVQEVLYFSEPVYYCPYCNARISEIRDKSQKKEAKELKEKTA